MAATSTGPVAVRLDHVTFRYPGAVAPALYDVCLDLPAGTAVRFEPGEIKIVYLIALAGQRQVYGGNGVVMGPLDDPEIRQVSFDRLRQAGF